MPKENPVTRGADRRRSDRRTDPGKRRAQFWRFTIAYVFMTLVMLWAIQLLRPSGSTKSVSYDEFVAAIETGRLAEVNITDRELIGLVKGSPKDNPNIIRTTRVPQMDESRLLDILQNAKVKFSGEITVRPWWADLLLSWIVPIGLLFGFYAYSAYRMQRGVGPMTFGKNKARIYDRSAGEHVTFADVAGVDEAEAELVEVVDFLKTPDKYRRLGGRIPKGVLLVGPPGTGKTLLARAVAGEAGVPFFSISGSEFVEMFVGLGAARVRDLFEQAKQKAPCIIFIDELDAIGKSRSAGRGMIMSHDEREQTLNQLLVEMDGFDASKGVIIMAATNTPEVLDPALMRAGRFDRQVIVDRPDVGGREAILKVHAAKVKLGSDVRLEVIAARTPGMVGADLANIVNEAALLAARRGSDAVNMRDLEEAIDRVTLGLEKKNRVMTEEEKARVAHHEVGHTLVALAVKHADPVHRVSIVPRSIGALGHTLQLPAAEKYLMTEPELEDRIAVLLGGRAAEELVYDGVVSTGASDDLEKASELVRQMITRFGMSEELGLMTWGRTQQSQFLQLPGMEERNYSEETARRIDEAARAKLESIYKRVQEILHERREAVERVSQELIRRETLSREEIQALLAQRSAA